MNEAETRAEYVDPKLKKAAVEKWKIQNNAKRFPHSHIN